MNHLQIRRSFNTDNPSGAHLWRAQLLRSAFPDLQTSAILPVEPNLPKSMSGDKVDVLYRLLCNSFLKGPIMKLLRSLSLEEEKACKLELFRLYVQAGNLQTRLKTHRANIQWGEPIRCIGYPFTVGSEYFKADRVHRLEDDEDTSHDGQEVCIVLSPPVIISGDQHGDNYDSERVVAKGIVVLQEPHRSKKGQPMTTVKRKEEEMKNAHVPRNNVTGAYPPEVKREDEDLLEI